MSSHTCACHYGPDGRCIWCHMSPQDLKHPWNDPNAPLPPYQSLGTGKKSSTYIPFSSWGRQQTRRSAIDALGEDFFAVLEEDEDLKQLQQLLYDRRTPDRIIGAGEKKSSGATIRIRKGHL